MDKEIHLGGKISFFLFLGLVVFPPMMALAGETPTMVIEEAKFAIDQARKAGAEQKAYDDLSAAKSWLSRAEKEYDEARSFFSRMSTSKTQKAKDDEIIYLATMAKIKATVAENKAKKDAILKDLQDTRKDLADYQGAIAVLKKKLEEVQKAKEIQAKAEAERKELEEAQKKAKEMEALSQKELKEVRLKEAERAAAREKELAQAKLKAEQLAAQRAKEEAEMKSREAKLAALQAKAEALEKEKTMLAGASKILNVTVKIGEKEIVITILAINLFTPATELKAQGKEILDNVGNFLKAHPNHKVIVRGHTDSVGKEEVNQALSEKRAQKVREYLVAYQDIQPTRVTTQGVGPSQPVATNTTEAGRALNRRVEIAIQTGE
ncbi:MAG: OmpA family protein [Deltaproteobacteria bacterium]|nr:OmpA family protein [Deltaproteobacteria bacterium]